MTDDGREDAVPMAADDGPDDAGVVTLVVGDAPAEASPAAPVTDWEVDGICANAVDVARAAVLEQTGAATVGDHCGLVSEGPSVVTHFFEGRVPGYVGWRWAVTVARAPDSATVTVDEVALLPDGDALLAPSWVPWKQRIQSGDLGAGDVLVTEADDPRLVPGLADNDLPDPDETLRPEQWELGLGRVRMLSPEGRRDAAARWYRQAGPRSPAARSSGLQCSACGFLLLIGGPMGQAFGVCANGFSPSDGRVVALSFGCGAHSEMVERPSVPVAEVVVDEFGYEDLGPDVAATPADDVDPVGADTPAEGPAPSGADAGPAGDQEGPSPGEGESPTSTVGEAAEHVTTQQPGPEEDA